MAARELSERTGAVLVHPFDHVDVVAGQASLGAEVLEQVPEARTLLVCTGGGGLLAGVALAADRARRAGRDVTVVGVAGGERGGLPGLAGRRHPGPAGADVDHGRRDRRRPPR